MFARLMIRTRALVGGPAAWRVLRGPNAARLTLAALCLLPSAPVARSAADERAPGRPTQPLPADAFADELNPFGGRRPDAGPARDAGPAAAATEQPRGRVRPPLPVPFPDADAGPAAGPGAGQAGVAGAAGPQRPAAAPQPPFPGDDADEPRKPSPADPLVAEAEELERRGDLAGARDRLRAALEADPQLSVAYLALGVVLRRMGDFDGSVEVLSRGIVVDPLDAELRLRRGIAWFHLGIFGIALEDFEDASGLAYEDPRPELWRGLTLMELGRTLEAINAYAASIRRDRGFKLGYMNRGLAYLQADEPARAEYDFDLVIRADPRDVEAWFGRGVAQARQGRFGAAMLSYSEALERNPRFEPARRNLEAARRLAGRR